MQATLLGLQTSVVGQGGNALRIQPVGGLLDLSARQAINDAGIAFVLVTNELQKLSPRIVAILNKTENKVTLHKSFGAETTEYPEIAKALHAAGAAKKA